MQHHKFNIRNRSGHQANCNDLSLKHTNLPTELKASHSKHKHIQWYHQDQLTFLPYPQLISSFCHCWYGYSCSPKLTSFNYPLSSLSFSYNPSASPQHSQDLAPSFPTLPKANSFQPFSELTKASTDWIRVTQELRYSFLTHFVFLLPKPSRPLLSVSVVDLSPLPHALWTFSPSQCNSVELSIFLSTPCFICSAVYTNALPNQVGTGLEIPNSNMNILRLQTLGLFLSFPLFLFFLLLLLLSLDLPDTGTPCMHKKSY